MQMASPKCRNRKGISAAPAEPPTVFLWPPVASPTTDQMLQRSPVKGCYESLLRDVLFVQASFDADAVGEVSPEESPGAGQHEVAAAAALTMGRESIEVKVGLDRLQGDLAAVCHSFGVTVDDTDAHAPERAQLIDKLHLLEADLGVSRYETEEFRRTCFELECEREAVSSVEDQGWKMARQALSRKASREMQHQARTESMVELSTNQRLAEMRLENQACTHGSELRAAEQGVRKAHAENQSQRAAMEQLENVCRALQDENTQSQQQVSRLEMISAQREEQKSEKGVRKGHAENQSQRAAMEQLEDFCRALQDESTQSQQQVSRLETVTAQREEQKSEKELSLRRVARELRSEGAQDRAQAARLTTTLQEELREASARTTRFELCCEGLEAALWAAESRQALLTSEVESCCVRSERIEESGRQLRLNLREGACTPPPRQLRLDLRDAACTPPPSPSRLLLPFPSRQPTRDKASSALEHPQVCHRLSVYAEAFRSEQDPAHAVRTFPTSTLLSSTV